MFVRTDGTRVTVAFAAFLCLATGAMAIPPTPVRTDPQPQMGLSQPAPSPDGADLVFVFAGDLWSVSKDGGSAARLTETAEEESRPFWSPDGRHVAFARHEGQTQNVFLLDLETRYSRRLTEHESVDVPCGFSKDGQSVLFQSLRSGESRLFQVGCKGGEPQPILEDLSSDGCWVGPDEWVFVRSQIPWWRQRARGNGAGEIYRVARGSSNPVPITSFEGVDLWPSFDPGANLIYYTSEEAFTRNVWRVDLGTGEKSQVTTHRSGAAEFPQVSRDGSCLFYEQSGTLWRVDFTSDGRRIPSAAEQLRVDCRRDFSARVVRHYSSGAVKVWTTPKSQEVVLQVDGHLFSSPDPLLAPWSPLASSSFREYAPSWSSDGRRLVLSTDRDGQHDLLLLESDADSTTVVQSQEPSETLFRHRFRNEYAPLFSPGGSFIAYHRQYEEVEQLVLADSDGGREIVLAEGVRFAGMAFAPDGRWLAYSKRDRSGNAEIYLQSLFGGGEYNLSLHPADDLEPSWSPDGRYLFFLSNRAGSQDVWALALHDRDAEIARTGSWPVPRAEFPEKGVTAELVGLPERQFQVTQLFGDEREFSIHSSGAQFLFISEVLGSPALYVKDWESEHLIQISFGWTPVSASYDPETQEIWSVDKEGLLRKSSRPTRNGNAGTGNRTDTDVDSGGSWKTEIVPYSFALEMDTRARRDQILTEAWRWLDDGFYRPHFHLLDWEAVLQRYRDRLPGVHTEHELDRLIRQMMGELNASHLGLRAPTDKPRVVTGFLGVKLAGDGQTVIGLLERGPAAREGVQLGDQLVAVDGDLLGQGRPLESILRNKVGDEVELRWISGSREAQTETETETLLPISLAEVRHRERAQEIGRAQTLVHGLGQSALGYVRLDAIDRPQLDQLRRVLRTGLASREGLILDLRNNLGGDLPAEFLRALQVRSALWREPRGERRQASPTPLWEKPLVVLIGPNTGSAAELVAEGVSELGLGTLVGAPTAGGVIGTEEIRLVDGRVLRVPQVGWSTSGGDNLEGRGVLPDVWIGHSFEYQLEAEGQKWTDPVLKAAIQVLEDDISRSKRTQSGLK